MADDIEVRRLTPEDAPLLVTVLQLLRPKGDEHPPSARETHLRHALASEHCYAFVAFMVAAPVGYASAYRFPRLDAPGDQAYVFDIEVETAARRRGVGRRLAEAVLAACWADGVTWAWAGTSTDNTAAQRLFAAVGGVWVSENYVEFHFTPEPTE